MFRASFIYFEFVDMWHNTERFLNVNFYKFHKRDSDFWILIMCAYIREGHCILSVCLFFFFLDLLRKFVWLFGVYVSCDSYNFCDWCCKRNYWKVWSFLFVFLKLTNNQFSRCIIKFLKLGKVIQIYAESSYTYMYATKAKLSDLILL